MVFWGRFRPSKIIGGGGEGVPRTTTISYSEKMCIDQIGRAALILSPSLFTDGPRKLVSYIKTSGLLFYGIAVTSGSKIVNIKKHYFEPKGVITTPVPGPSRINCSIFLYRNSFGANQRLALTRKSFRIAQVSLCEVERVWQRANVF